MIAMAKKNTTQEKESIEDSLSQTFEDGGKIYQSDPTMEEFLCDAGIAKSNVRRIKDLLNKQSVTDSSMLRYLSMEDLTKIEGIGEGVAFSLAKHGIRLRHKGNPIKNMEEMEHLTKEFLYLASGSPTFDEMMTHASGNIGFRSRALVELYGEPASGKTQICINTAIMTMRPKDQGGWHRGIAYIDSEGAFDVHRFKALARYWGVPDDFINDHIMYSRVTNFDEVEIAIDRISNEIRSKNIGTVIVDSIMDPLRSSYPVGGYEMKNLQPRQKHLKRVMDKLKLIANLHNVLVLYTNHVRTNMGDKFDPTTAQGGVVLGHASDIRIYLDKPTRQEREQYFQSHDHRKLKENGIDIRRAKIMDCGFLAAETSEFLIGFFGLGEPYHWRDLLKQAIMVKEKGYICIDALGDELEPPEGENFMTPDERFKQRMQQVYGVS